MNPFIAIVTMFGGNFAPRGWALCHGQLLFISQNSALFSLLGTTYGGDGRTTFGLPDLRGRAAMHPGNGPGLSSYRLGQKGGQEQVQLTLAQIPNHDHQLNAAISSLRVQSVNDLPDSTDPSGSYLANRTSYSDTGANVNMGIGSVKLETSSSGGNQPHNNMQPFQAVNFIIALFGVYPSRS